MNYLLDTNICIYFLKGKYELDQKFDKHNFHYHLHLKTSLHKTIKYCLILYLD